MAGKLAVVTGASSGFGLLASVELARRGMRVCATMRDLGRAAALEQALRDAGVSARTVELDVVKPASVDRAFADIEHTDGPVDILVNNAGYALGGFVEDLSMAELREQLETNFFGLVQVTKRVIPGMRERRSGRIINITSISGRVALPGLGAYAASKFAVEGLSEALRHELRPHGVFVSVVEPGSYRTDIWDRNRRVAARTLDESSPNRAATQRLTERIDRRVATALGDPQDVARAIANVATARRPRLRYLVGKDAIAELVVNRALPWRAWERVLDRLTGINEPS